MLRRVRALLRQLRFAPGVGAVIRFVDRVWWWVRIGRSGLVDVGYYRTQAGRGFVGIFHVAWHYTGTGFRRGMSPNPLFDELFAGSSLPEPGRVPALYAYLVSDRPTVRVHPWWDSRDPSPAARDADGVLERVWAQGATAALTLEAPGVTQETSVGRVRESACAAARAWRTGSGTAASADAPQHAVVIRPLRCADPRSSQKLGILAGLAAETGIRPLVTLLDPLASQWISAALFEEIVRGVRVELAARGAGLVDAVDSGFSLAPAAIVVTVDPRADLTADELRTLIAVAERGTLAIPATREWDGTVAGLGAAEVGADRPWPILRDHPAEDISEFADEIVVPLATGRTVALPADALAAAGRVAGDGPLPEDFLWEGWARRLAATGTGCVVVTGVRPVLDPPDALRGNDTRVDAALSDFEGSAPAPVVELVRRAGYRIDGWRAAGDGAPTPRLSWLRPDQAASRWAIKICAPAGRAGEVWGDTHFARGLAAALRRRGQTVVVDAFDARRRATSYLDDVVVVVRGPYRIDPPDAPTKIEWIISHPDAITADEVGRFDHVFAVSPGWARRASTRFGRLVLPLLEATDADLFHPRGLSRGADIVFVGTARGIARPSVVTPLRAGIPVRVYGPDWRPFIPAAAVVADSIPNEQLSELYESASIVLNDHWPAMRREGFMAMRPFDVVAAGGRVISERVDGIEELFEGAVAAYDTEDELLELLRRPADEIFPDEAELARIAARIRAEHSFDARAAELIEVVRRDHR